MVHLERSVWLPACGAALGLALAGHALFTAKGSATRSVPHEDVALVNQRPILMSDFIAQVQTLASKPFDQTSAAERGKVLDDMVREELFVQRGLEMDFAATDADTRNALVAAVEQQIVAEVELAPPSDAVLRAYHAAHAQAFASAGTMNVQAWTLPADADAGADPSRALARVRQALIEVRAGADFEATLSRAGLHDSGRGHGEIYYVVAREQLGAALFDQARLLAAGAISEPISGPGASVHVLRMLGHEPPRPLGFELARTEVLKAYLREQAALRKRATEAYLRGKAEILLAAPYAAR